MASHNELGKKGEVLAQKWLSNIGYQILETNWRFSKAEIDIIAKDENILVFIEVKTRSYESFGSPETFVDEQKEIFMLDAANVYMEKIGHDWEIRFDIVAVTLYKGRPPKIRHFKDAFFPSW